MPNQTKLVLGFHAPTWTEPARQLMDGVLRYIEEEPALQIRDFRFSKNDRAYAGDPPWKGQVDGVILNAANGPGAVAWMERGDVPAISTAADFFGTSIPCVSSENISIARLSAQHVADAGYRFAAYIGKIDYDISRQRCRMLEQELSAYEIPLRSIELDTIPRIGYDQPDCEVSYNAILSLLNSLDEPTLIICLNDSIAAAVLKLALETGRKVPEQLGILGVGDTDVIRISDPPISSVRVDRDQIGYQAAKHMHRILRGIELDKMFYEVPAIDIAVRRSTMKCIPELETYIDHAIDFIKRHALEGIRLQDISDAVSVPLRTLEIDFKRSTGRTMGDMIQQLRLERAKHLLETTDLSTQRIATQIGFTHYSTLSRMMVRMLEMTPSEYRERHRSNQGTDR